VAGLCDFVKTTARPQDVLQLLIMLKDVEYLSYLADNHPNEPQNVGLMLIANEYHADIKAVKAECKKASLSKLRKSEILDSPPAKPRKTSAKQAQAQIAQALQEQDDQSAAEPAAADSDLLPRAAISAKPGKPIAYRGPNGETWSGRGLKPRWVTAYLDNGGALDDLKTAGVAA